MNCAYHNEIQAEAYCRTCGKPLCTACKRDVKGVIFCEDCIAARVTDAVPASLPPLPPDAATRPPRAEGAPSPGLATLLGFIPGVGAMYNGQFAKGFVHILIFGGLITLASNVHNMEPLFGMMVAGFYVYMIIDAYKTARAREMGQPAPNLIGIDAALGLTNAPEPAATTGDVKGAPVGAIVLIGLGVLFLIHNMGLFHFNIGDFFFPVAITAFGVWLYMKPRPGVCECPRCKAQRLVWPAILVTLGTLMLLDNLPGESLEMSRTWPLLFIVGGVVRLMQARASSEGHQVVPPAPLVPPQTERTEVGNA